MSTALECHPGGRKSGREAQERKPDPLSPEDCRCVPSPCLPIRSIALLGWVRNDHLLGLGVATYSDAGDEITLTGEIGWPPQINRDKIGDTAREHARQNPAGCHYLLPTRGM